jgi:hypothetical protein
LRVVVLQTLPDLGNTQNIGLQLVDPLQQLSLFHYFNSSC